MTMLPIDLDHVPADYAEAVEMLKRAKAHIELLKEVRDALFNLAPRFRERGCFGNSQFDCLCTACKLRRAIAELEPSPSDVNSMDALHK